MNNVSNPLYPLGRALIGVLFAVSGITKIFGFSYVAGWMASSGMPFASVLLAATIVLEIGAGSMLITGIQARFAALALALFLIPTTAIFHAFWSADAASFQGQLTHFLKNVAIFGSVLIVYGIERQRHAGQARPAGANSRIAI
jgi:putative oxidoreductase